MSVRALFLTPFFVTAIVAPAFGQFATAPVTYTRESLFPPVSLANGETAQVNVVNTAKAPTNGTAASCTGTISFSNSSGTATGNPVSFTVAAGQIFSTTFPNNSATRTAILATVQQTLSLTPVASNNTTAPCSLVLSLEIFSATTHVVLGSSTATGGPIQLLSTIVSSLP